jgi:hypothetical protein
LLALPRLVAHVTYLKLAVSIALILKAYIQAIVPLNHQKATPMADALVLRVDKKKLVLEKATTTP